MFVLCCVCDDGEEGGGGWLVVEHGSKNTPRVDVLVWWYIWKKDKSVAGDW